MIENDFRKKILPNSFNWWWNQWIENQLSERDNPMWKNEKNEGDFGENEAKKGKGKKNYRDKKKRKGKEKKKKII